MAVPKKKTTPSTSTTISIAGEVSERKLTLEERLAAKAGKKEETKSASSKDWRISLSDKRFQELALTLAAGTHGKKVIEGQVKTARAELEPELIRMIAAEWFKQQRQAENPTVTAPGCQFKFVLAETSNAILKARAKNTNISEVMTKHGVSPDIQAKIMNDFKTEKIYSVDSDSIKKDNPELYEKFIELLLLANEEGVYNSKGEEVLRISDEDMAKLVSQDTKISVANGFLDRLPAYAVAAGDVEQLVSALGAIEELGVINYRIPNVTVDSPEATIDRLVRGAPTEPTQVSQGFKTADNKFLIEAKGDEVVCTTIPQTPEEVSKVLFKKKCPGGVSHAINLARQLSQKPNRLAEEIASAAK